MPNQHREGYHRAYRAAERIVLRRFKAEQPDVYARWLAEARADTDKEQGT